MSGEVKPQEEKSPETGGISSMPESLPNLGSVAETLAVDAEGTVVSDEEFEKKRNYDETEAQGKDERGGNRKFETRTRQHWYQFWRFKNPPRSPPASLDDAESCPLGRKSFISDWSYSWIEPLLLLGYRRPLEATDLWAMDGPRQAEYLSDRLIERWSARVEKANAYNARLDSGEIKPSGYQQSKWRSAAKKEAAANVGGEATVEERMEAKAYCWRSPLLKDIKAENLTPEIRRRYNIAGKVKTQYKRANLFWAMFDIFWGRIAVAYVSKLLSDTAYLCSALLMRHIIGAIGDNKRGLASGYTVVMFVIMVISNVLSNRFFYESMYIGVFARAALVSSIFRRAIRMQGRDRSTGKLVNHVSTDVSRIDFGAQWWLLTFTAPVEIVVCLVILLTQGMGASCLAGFALVAVVMPVQLYCMKFLFTIRKHSMEWTDRRARRTQEVLSGMRIVKLFSYESSFLKLISKLRKNELIYVFQLAVVRAAVMASAISLPLLAGVVSVVTYYFYHTPHRLDPGVVFPAITLFQILRLPLMFLPFGLSVIADGANSFMRLRDVFYAEQHDVEVKSNEQSMYGLQMSDALFEWDNVGEDPTLKPTPTQEKKQKRKNEKMWAFLRKNRKKTPKEKQKETEKKRRRFFRKKSKNKEALVDPTMPPPKATEEEEPPTDFALSPLTLAVKRGELCAIVGPVGSGKSSLLLGAIGEMRHVSGDVTWGSQRIAYCAQSAWIQNATLRDNIVFGQPWDEARYWECVERAELPSDLAMLQNGDMTEIGERGVTLSGGQKQRVNIARALYYDADVICLDDPLSAVDAHVGKALFNNAILPMKEKGKTILLVTHAIQYLPDCDKIISMDDGRIEEMGTYQELMQARGNFFSAMRNFGMLKETGEDEDAEELAAETENAKKKKPKLSKAEMSKPNGGGTMEQEERNTGSVDGFVYRSYIMAGQGWWTIPLAVAAAVLMQGSTTLSTYYINWWARYEHDHTIGFWIGLYVMLGILQLLFNFVTDVTLGLFTYMASRTLHDNALRRVIYAPMAWFDTTPLGRIINRFGKDIDVLDNQLSNLLRQCVSTVMSMLGAAAMIIALTYYFAIAIVVIAVIAWVVASFYRSSAREFKRIDALLRSTMYSHFAESLGGLTTIRAYRKSDHFLNDNYRRVDLQNRAYFLTIVNQRWLGLRLDLLGSLSVLVVGLLVSNHVGSDASPGAGGTALSMIITIAQTLGFLTRQLTELENEMNSAERLVYYADTLKQEAAQRIPEAAPAAPWPNEGSVEFDDVWLQYRPTLPNVLKGVSLHVRGGEKVGIVGRTGAGKSSILTVLLRLSEATRGVVRIDGVDVAKIGLEDLRRAIAILPQEPLLFSGSLRSNLDPFTQYDDARLWDAMHRAYLTSQSNSASASATASVEAAINDPDVPATERTEMEAAAMTAEGGGESKGLTRLTLDSIIDEEGANLSVGQRSLVSLARALVRNSKIILLDEATASVDLETDAKIQKTIRNEFADRTLLCIAHRLSTIIGYDRIVVMNDGKVAEYDSPLALFDRPDSIFRGMCDRSGIKREEVVQARMPPAGSA